MGSSVYPICLVMKGIKMVGKIMDIYHEIDLDSVETNMEFGSIIRASFYDACTRQYPLQNAEQRAYMMYQWFIDNGYRK